MSKYEVPKQIAYALSLWRKLAAWPNAVEVHFAKHREDSDECVSRNLDEAERLFMLVKKGEGNHLTEKERELVGLYLKSIEVSEMPAERQ